MVRRARAHFVAIPGILALAIFFFWGADQAVRIGLHWSQAVWLAVIAAVLALLTTPLVLPITVGLDALLDRFRAGRALRYIAYAVTFVVLGALVAAATETISSTASVLAGLFVGVMMVVVFERTVPRAR